MKFLLVLLFLLIQLRSHSAVWEGIRSWQEGDLESYSSWIEQSLKDDIFSNPKSEYYGIKTDCADVIYALMIIFSYEKRLNIEVKLKDDSIISNETAKFDSTTDNAEKLKLFIEYISKNTSTYTLSKYNSLPLAISEIRPGDTYITSFEIDGLATNHAYIIKNLIPTGHFELYSSTTPSKVRKLNIRKGYPLHIIKNKPWGFKRAIPYPLIQELKSKSEIYNDEQYDILNSSPKEYFSIISKMIATQEDSFDVNINHQFDNICDMLTSRINEVKEAVAFKEDKNRCLSQGEYDLYSTPTRDKNIQLAFNRLLTGWKKIKKDGIEVSANNYSDLETILGKNKDDDSMTQLYRRCPLIIGDKKITLRTFFYSQYLEKVSSNPNDDELARWGLSSVKSSCKRPSK